VEFLYSKGKHAKKVFITGLLFIAPCLFLFIFLIFTYPTIRYYSFDGLELKSLQFCIWTKNYIEHFKDELFLDSLKNLIYGSYDYRIS